MVQGERMSEYLSKKAKLDCCKEDLKGQIEQTKLDLKRKERTVKEVEAEIEDESNKLTHDEIIEQFDINLIDDYKKDLRHFEKMISKYPNGSQMYNIYADTIRNIENKIKDIMRSV